LPDRSRRSCIAQGAADEETSPLVERLLPDRVHLSVDIARSFPAEGLPKEREHLSVGLSAPAHLVPGGTVRFRLVAQHLDANLLDVGGPVETSRQPVVGEVVLDAVRIHDLREMWQSWIVRECPDDGAKVGEMNDGLAEARRSRRRADHVPESRSAQV